MVSPVIPPLWKWGAALSSVAPHLNWRARRESNPHSLGSKPSALSIKLRAHASNYTASGADPTGRTMTSVFFELSSSRRTTSERAVVSSGR